VCIRVGMRGVQVATQLFYEDPNRAAYIGNRGVYEARHELSIIAVIGGGWFRGSHSRPAKAEIAIIEASRGGAQPGSAPALGAPTPAPKPLIDSDHL
jgi:hypothetical protein